MTLIKKTLVDEITITENGVIMVRETTKILEDGIELSKNYHRTTLIPTQNISNQPANVVAICNATWTPEVIAAYQKSLPQNLTTGA
jgi:archaellum component FlaF (FlaF/FlaG flagellin family)